MEIRTILQDFEWNLPADCQHWSRVAAKADEVAKLGFTDVWLPPAYKGHEGIFDVGYGVYDLYDLGEFPAKGHEATKYGTRERYLYTIGKLHENGLKVMADIVLNHRMGADRTEWVKAHKYRPNKRLSGYVKTTRITASSLFKFPERNGRYSTFKWNHTHFTAVDSNKDNERGTNKLNGGIHAIYKFFGHRWETEVDKENQNYDYLMGCDVDFNNPEVKKELENWGKWYIDTAEIDSFRLDAIKHISFRFFPKWLAAMRAHAKEKQGKEEFFAVGEYWHGDVKKLLHYLDKCGRCMSLFDVALHYHLYHASEAGADYDLRTIFDDTLVKADPWHAVTFVDNHDTQPGQALESWIRDWFKQSAYALVLLRRDGLPCVFYGDLYGLKPYYKDKKDHPGIPPLKDLDKLLLARKDYATGKQRDYFAEKNLIGWTREGGAAVVISNDADGSIEMKHGVPGQVYIDMLGNCTDKVVIKDNGSGDFPVKGRSVSVWVPKE